MKSNKNLQYTFVSIVISFEVLSVTSFILMLFNNFEFLFDKTCEYDHNAYT